MLCKDIIAKDMTDTGISVAVTGQNVGKKTIIQM
jgi:hypothetical protein